MQASELFNQPNTILLDGGMGTMLQAAGMKLGTRPEDLNIENPELIRSIHAKYAAAGSRVVNANTFGASPHKLADSKYTLEEIITAGIANCKQAVAPYGALVTLDVGPLGELLEPSGTLAFEDAVAEYGRIVRAGVAAGADILYFETFTDLYEMKAALLAAKENSTLPIMASMSFEADGAAYLMQHQMLDNSYDMPESVQTFDAFWRVWYAGESRPERRMIFGHTHRRLVHRLDNDRLWLNPGSASYRRPDDRDKRAHYMLIEDGDIRFGAVEYDRSAMLARAMDYVKKGTMLETDLQDAMFFFGDAPTSREPLPR